MSEQMDVFTEQARRFEKLTKLIEYKSGAARVDMEYTEKVFGENSEEYRKALSVWCSLDMIRICANDPDHLERILRIWEENDEDNQL